MLKAYHQVCPKYQLVSLAWATPKTAISIPQKVHAGMLMLTYPQRCPIYQ